MAKGRGGKRLGAGRPRQDPTKTIRVPVNAIPALKAFVELYKGGGTCIDYAMVNVALAKTRWCQDRGDFLDRPEICRAVELLNERATVLSKSNSAFDASRAERLDSLANEWRNFFDPIEAGE